jgi:hypothetical protein
MSKDEQVTLFQDDACNITIYNVPADLVKEFCQKVVWPTYPGGISEAIQDLMRRAVQEQGKAQS